MTQRLTLVPYPNPSHFDLIVREIYEREKGKGVQKAHGEIETSLQIEPVEEEAEQALKNEVEWSLDKAQVQLSSAKKLKILADLPTLSGVIIKNVGDHLLSQPPKWGIILPAFVLHSGFPIPFP